MKLAFTKIIQSKNSKIFIFSAFIVTSLILIFIYQDYFSLNVIKQISADTLYYIEHNRLQGALIFMACYFLICALPFPFVSAPTILAGFLFGNIVGLLIVSFVSALGGTCLFLMTRYLCRDWLQRKFVDNFSRLNRASNSNSFMLSLSMRLIPGMPFCIPAIILGLSKLNAWKFYASTQLGLVSILFVYVNAGRNLSTISSIDDIFSMQLILSLLLLAVVPLILSFIASKKKFALD